MVMTNEDYVVENIREISTVALYNEYTYLTDLGIETTDQMEDAEDSKNMGLLFAYASDVGVINAKQLLIIREVERRDKEDGPMSEAESNELATAALMQALGVRQ